ncbi:hypothetical protein TNCT_378491 [Trichonephila clavata]|uniref:EF-1-gamma C-terminal domain-containing protein n=1 Tax=Trichonephila clavata TaxID=2740835 RepID=A0A8X6HL82_TRICU|nr:hypothetical protein TNCT_378491 [Trichonephila clavata]
MLKHLLKFRRSLDKERHLKQKKQLLLKTIRKRREKKPKRKKLQLAEPDETELALAQEPKSKDPFEKFPKGTFIMDEFKLMYNT